MIEHDLFGKKRDKVQTAIDRLRAFEPPEGYYLAFSGGKDSQCIIELAKLAGVKFDVHYSVTSVDPPELVRFIRDAYPDVSRDIPHDKNGKPITMWNLIPRKLIPPTRIRRYCCSVLKESNGKGRVVVTGVRWAESQNRNANQGVVTMIGAEKKAARTADEAGAKFKIAPRGGLVMNDDNDASRRTVEHCYRISKTLINPIVDWSKADVWEFLNDVARVCHCELYDQGFDRLGCIGCPMSNHQEEELIRWPAYRDSYLRAFARMIFAREEKGLNRPLTSFTSAQAVMDWWLSKARNKAIEGQILMLEDGDGDG